MSRKYYTYNELVTMKLADLPNIIKKAILKEVAEKLGMMTEKLANTLENVPVLQFEKYCDIFKYIQIIC